MSVGTLTGQAPVVVRGRGAGGSTIERASGTAHALPALDGLRGVAILLVFLSHSLTTSLAPATTRVDSAVRTVATAGWTGVDLFFVLSGLLITGILLDTRGQPGWWPNFVARRVLRIFPLYYGALMVCFVLLPQLFHWSDPAFRILQANQSWYWTYSVNVLASLTRLQGTPLNTVHFWSLSIEEQFYLIWPLIVWACDSRALLRVALVAVIGGFAFRLGLVLQDPGDTVPAFFLTPGRLDGLMTGAALAVVARMPGGLARLRALAPRALVSSVLALGALVILRGGLDPHDPVVVVAGLPGIALLYGALVAMALTAPRTSRLVRTLHGAWLRKWGQYSYGVYVIHYPLLGALAGLTTARHHGAALLGGSRLPSGLLLTAVGMSMSYALAWLSYHAYEKRFLQLKRYFPRQPGAALAPRCTKSDAPTGHPAWITDGDPHGTPLARHPAPPRQRAPARP